LMDVKGVERMTGSVEEKTIQKKRKRVRRLAVFVEGVVVAVAEAAAAVAVATAVVAAVAVALVLAAAVAATEHLVQEDPADHGALEIEVAVVEASLQGGDR